MSMMNSLEMVNCYNSQMAMITERIARTFIDITDAIREQTERLAFSDHRSIQEISGRKKSQDIELQQRQNASPRLQEQNLDNPQTSKIKIKKSGFQRPKKPLKAFKLYLAEFKRKLSQDNIEMKGEDAKIAAKQWSAMSEEDKMVYTEIQKKETKNYQAQLEEFYRLHPQQNKKSQAKKLRKSENGKVDRASNSAKKEKTGKSKALTSKKEEEGNKNNIEAHQRVEEDELQKQLVPAEQQNLIENELPIMADLLSRGNNQAIQIEIEQYLDLQPESDSLGGDI